MKLYPYKQGSKGAKALADALGIKQIRHEGKPMRFGGTLINWGASHFKRKMEGFDILNKENAVTLASNKLATFKLLSAAGVSVPDWTVDPDEVRIWLAEGYAAVARYKLNGHSGEGIEIIEGHQAWEDHAEDAPLYTRYIKKKEEYRIHIFQGEAFFVQRKARKLDVPAENVNWKVRNLAGGFIFANVGVEVDDVARHEACAAVAALSLDFGAVDVILGTDGKYYVLEVNTACGLEGTTLEKYVEKFQQFK